MTETDMTQLLLSLGCKEWQKGGHHRIYVPIDVACQAIGLRVGYYQSGNVSWAKLNEKQISNSCAREMLSDLSQVYFDVASGTFAHSAYHASTQLWALLGLIRLGEALAPKQ